MVCIILYSICPSSKKYHVVNQVATGYMSELSDKLRRHHISRHLLSASVGPLVGQSNLSRVESVGVSGRPS